MTTEEFAAYCAELAAKLQDGRALEEARARLQARRVKRRCAPTEDDKLDADYAWDRYSPESNRWHD